MRLSVISIALILLFSPWTLWAAEWVQESPGQKAYYDDQGQLERLELDADGDGRFEAEERYQKRRRTERLEDHDGDGRWERKYLWHQDGTATLTERGRKGRLQKTYYDASGAVSRIEKDGDRDGEAESVWEYSGGQLQKVCKPRGTWYYRNGKLNRAELDEDRNGRNEKIEYYRHDGRLAKVEELAASGKVHCTWSYDDNGKPLSAAQDTNGDGHCDLRRKFHRDGTMEQTVDADRNGVPEIRERFTGDGRLLSREEDLDGDGVFDLRTGRVAKN